MDAMQMLAWSSDSANVERHRNFKLVMVQSLVKSNLEQILESTRINLSFGSIYQSWEPRLSEKVSPGRERLTREGEIPGYTEGFSPERELFCLSESGLA
ncbi:hypothetical protein Lal_00038968 [Lupinus albus]|nr:hypothetical protein Lal_00038968 [Lupinus albus]